MKIRGSETHQTEGINPYKTVKNFVNKTVDRSLFSYACAAWSAATYLGVESIRFFATAYVKANQEDPQAILLRSQYSYLLKNNFDPKNPSGICVSFSNQMDSLASTIGSLFKYFATKGTLKTPVIDADVVSQAKTVSQKEVEDLFSGFKENKEVVIEAIKDLRNKSVSEEQVNSFFDQHIVESPFVKVAKHISYATYQMVKESLESTFNALCNGGVSSYQQNMNQGFTLLLLTTIFGLSATTAWVIRGKRKASQKVVLSEKDRMAMQDLFLKQKRLMQELLSLPEFQQILAKVKSEHAQRG